MNEKAKNIELLERELIDISQKLNYEFPSEYCAFYIKQLTPYIKPDLFKVNGKEKKISYLFTTNSDDKKCILNFQKFDSEYEKILVPFAELEFGDLLCFNRNENSVIYYDHENDTITKVANSWEDFYRNLYN